MQTPGQVVDSGSGLRKAFGDKAGAATTWPTCAWPCPIPEGQAMLETGIEVVARVVHARTLAPRVVPIGQYGNDLPLSIAGAIDHA